MDEIDDVVIFDGFSLDLHLEFVVRHQLEHPLWDVLVYDQVSSCLQHRLGFIIRPSNLCFIAQLIVSLLDGYLNLGRCDRKRRFVAAEYSVVDLS